MTKGHEGSFYSCHGFRNHFRAEEGIPFGIRSLCFYDGFVRLVRPLAVSLGQVKRMVDRQYA